FAFTGNKFEFRACASSQSVSFPLAVINTIVAESLDFMATELERTAGTSQAKLQTATKALLKKIIKEHKRVVFNGDNYTEDWVAEAEKRGLPHLRTTPEALGAIRLRESVAVFQKYKVLSKDETHMRLNIYAEQYATQIGIEAEAMGQMTRRSILPAANRYQAELAHAVVSAENAGIDTADQRAFLECYSSLLSDTMRLVSELEKAACDAHHDDELRSAELHRVKVVTAMDALREVVDELERHTADDLWPLPNYREMLFLK
ncbi:MAG: glutamine synthetase type III, partial [Planctomycetota bacterium]